MSLLRSQMRNQSNMLWMPRQRGHSIQNLQQCLLDTGWCEHPVFRSNLDLVRSKRFGFYWSETTKSDLVFHDNFSTGVGATRERVLPWFRLVGQPLVRSMEHID
jgi:hypothetical protein